VITTIKKGRFEIFVQLKLKPFYLGLKDIVPNDLEEYENIIKG